MQENDSCYEKECEMMLRFDDDLKSAETSALKMGATFADTLRYFIISRGLGERQSKVYNPDGRKTSVIKRQYHSKVLNGKIKPDKKYVFAYALSLKMNIDEAEFLLARAGYSFSDNEARDVVVRYCIKNEIYNFYEVDSLLYKFCPEKQHDKKEKWLKANLFGNDFNN